MTTGKTKYEKTKEYRLKHPEKRKEEKKRYYAKHPEKKKEQHKRHYAKHSEAIKAYGKQYYIDHPEQIKAYSKQHNIDHPEVRKANALKKNFGITLQDYNDMLTLQVSGCTICGRTIQENGKALAVDHDHETGEIRELLCQSCNIALGLMNDSPEQLRKAVDYLEKHKNKNLKVA